MRQIYKIPTSRATGQPNWGVKLKDFEDTTHNKILITASKAESEEQLFFDPKKEKEKNKEKKNQE